MLLSLSAGAADAKRPTCLPTAGTTWAANEHLRLFQWGYTPDGFSVRFWVCGADARRPHFLVSGGWEYPDPRAAIGGRFVIFAKGSCQPDWPSKNDDLATCRGGISIYDAGRNTTRFVRSRRGVDGLILSVVTQVVTSRGWGAWVTADLSNSAHQMVWTLAPGGDPQMVAETTIGDTADTALALSGDRVFWQIGDELGSRVLEHQSGG